MARHWIHLEQVIGVLVRDSAGRAVGRIEEVHVEQSNGQALIAEFILGEQGLAQRLSISNASMFFLRWFGARHSASKTSHRVPWRKMDLSSPGEPTLRCTIEELKEFQ
jgi:sporulation protein YlmC with PRC-barrel domain